MAATSNVVSEHQSLRTIHDAPYGMLNLMTDCFVHSQYIFKETSSNIRRVLFNELLLLTTKHTFC